LTESGAFVDWANRKQQMLKHVTFLNKLSFLFLTATALVTQ